MQFASWLALAPVPFVPELLLHQADDMHALWEEVTALTGQETPPYWAFPWLGGQAVARFVLDRPEVVRGKRVLDLATGSGLVALAARRAGAAHVLANDIDPIAGEAVLANAEANGLDVTWWCQDLLDEPPPEVDVVFAGDILYDRDIAPRVMRWLGAARVPVYVGDPGRDYLPQQGLAEVAAYEIPTTRELEGVTLKRTRVFSLLPAGPAAAAP